MVSIALGAQDSTGALDTDLLARLIKAAEGMSATLHLIIDMVPDPLDAVDQAIDLGFDRILTLGTLPNAVDESDVVTRAVQRAAGRLSILPGCGLAPENVTVFRSMPGITEFLAAYNRPVPGAPAFSDFDPPGGRSETCEDDVRQMVAAITDLN